MRKLPANVFFVVQPSARLFEMFDQLYTLSDGNCVYQGSTKQLVPFLATLDLECPSYHNPASYIIEGQLSCYLIFTATFVNIIIIFTVACGEHGDHSRKLVNAIENGKRDIRTEADFEKIKVANSKNGDAKVRLSSCFLDREL
jgi:ATP-binding cassette, subfamily G (WHITE), member 1